MNLQSKNQLNLFELDNEFNELKVLFDNKKLPNKLLLSGSKGIGKCTLAYHLINYVLSKDEKYNYNFKKFEINPENKTYKLIQNRSNPNFILIDVAPEKKIIDISQIRNLIVNLNKSSLNSKPKFVLIDNIELLNNYSINALLKILEEPNESCHFILINNNKKILDTLRSRCLNFKISISNKKSVTICNKILGSNLHDLINKDLIDYYSTPGKILNLIEFSKEKNINLREKNLTEFLELIIEESYFKKENIIKCFIFDLIEFYLLKNISIHNVELFNNFLNRIENTKKFNLDEESLFFEFKVKFLNG